MKYIHFIVLISFISVNVGCEHHEGKGVEHSNSFKSQPKAIKAVPINTLKLGNEAPDFTLPNHEGKLISLDDFSDKKALAIVFTCNHCPTAQAYEDRLINITSDYSEESFQMIAITPNSPLGLLYNELGYTDLNDDFEAMKPRVDYKGYNFPYLYDGDDHAVSLKYGPVATPHAFVFNQDRKLIYVGRIDGSEKPGTGQGEDLRNAIDAALSNSTPETTQTKTFGCSTKWAWKTEYKAQDSIDWATKNIALELIDESGIEQLKGNTSGKLRLINVWATWCGPCVQEYPDFIVLQRMYGGRNFEFVSISADKPKDQEKVRKFLVDKQSAVSNYLFDSEDKYALIEAVDADWNGALPYSMLIDDKGDKVWAQQGTVDFLELKRAIVDHELMGRYY